jgi:hypothetical protein
VSQFMVRSESRSIHDRLQIYGGPGQTRQAAAKGL